MPVASMRDGTSVRDATRPGGAVRCSSSGELQSASLSPAGEPGPHEAVTGLKRQPTHLGETGLLSARLH